MSAFENVLRETGSAVLSRVPEGLDALASVDIARLRARKGPESAADLLVVLRDTGRMTQFCDVARFFAPESEVLAIPAWDCLPYDRSSPGGDVLAQRLDALARLSGAPVSRPRIVATTINALVQRVPTRAWIAAQARHLRAGQGLAMEPLASWLVANGYTKTPTVRETGEFAQRGGILDLFAPGTDGPVRLDFFGDTLESIRAFDAETQRTSTQLTELMLLPMSEVLLDDESIGRFRRAYLAQFGAVTGGDPLYESISAGRRYQGMEHWLGFFHEELETLFDHCGSCPVVLDPLTDEAVGERLEQIRDYYSARQAPPATGDAAPAYKPAPTAGLYLDAGEIATALGARASFRVTPFAAPEGGGSRIIDLGGSKSRDFAAERANPDVNLFEAAASWLKDRLGGKQRAVIAAASEGSAQRLGELLAEHGLPAPQFIQDAGSLAALPAKTPALAVLALEAGFETGDLLIVSEQDILGSRMIRQRKTRRASDFISEATALSAGDVVVHVDHGIGRFQGLKTIEAAGQPHDCLELHYAGGDKLFLPVENVELLSRYGGEDTEVQLDRLGGVAWQARKSRMKQRIREMAEKLIAIAAKRMMREAPVLTPPDGLYQEFCARFPFTETEDQLTAIDAVVEDIASGRPMDRLICGDVGFGKTEVAMRAAFIAAMSGRQVAVVVPTTLLARQHYNNFAERFAGLPIRVSALSRLVPAAERKTTLEGLKSGDVDIVVGTHALLGKTVAFRDLALVIVDEEQHFGVQHKERLKELRSALHVLTLSATPIPRTLQLAMTGIRELSLIATPPVDRLAVRTFVSPFDGVVLREAILREHYRGGQSFFVCPRVSDIEDMHAFLRSHVPEVKVAVAHGQMAPTALEDVMTAFYDRRFDVLLSTAIVESGLDVPTANTLIVHRADMFGLAQLYQLRGRVGRSKLRAYAYFTTPANRMLTPAAEKRLKVLQSLDTLGAGFSLASHDLDIRGAGNLLGEEQSGHIREVGYELYQSMLEEAVASLKSGDTDFDEVQWSPQISIGAAVLLPEAYIPDLDLRMALYRRLGGLQDDLEVDGFAAEMADRFGPVPVEAEHLLDIVRIKLLCRRANVEKVETGPKGIVLSFRDNRFAQPAALMKFIGDEGHRAKVRPDHRVFFSRDLPDAGDRLRATATIARKLASLAES
ncbi:MAG: transcription-repair coupling factor [Rhodobiaceae bacterium]|nr:transcription-repair coupling factor [Rhodobiaceae bacterium]